MLPGEYEFETSDKEVMEILAGDLQVLLPDRTEWIQISENQSFVVPEKSSFKLIVRVVTDYCCSYIK
jgi:purine/pyrimidine-nucleoside phosphorylase